jgi:Mrp family chromosome partitioning ATPase
MVTSPGSEPSRASVAVNLATVCAEIGQRVVVVTTEGFDVHVDGQEPPSSAGPLTDGERVRRLTGPLKPDEVRDLLGDTSVPGVSFLDLKHFVAHTTQVVIRVPEVLDALREVVDVVILEVPSFLSVHHGQGLAPLADLVLVVGERRLTTMDDLRKTSSVLKRLGAPVVGMALTTPSVRGDDEDKEDEEDEDDDEDVGIFGGRRRVRLPDVPSATAATEAVTVVDMAPLGFETVSDHRAVWDVPARPEA